MAGCQNLVPLVNIKIAGKWISIPLKMVLYVLTHSHIGNQCWDVSNLGGTICDTPMVRRFESCFGPPLQGASHRFGGPF